MRTILRRFIDGIAIFVVILSVLPKVQPVHAAPILRPRVQGIDACTASKYVLEMYLYLQTPDMGLAQAVEIAGDGFWISNIDDDFEMALHNAERAAKKGYGKNMSDFFWKAHRDDIVEVLKAAGYEKGVIRYTDVFGTPQNYWHKKEGWKDPCAPPPGGPAGQTESVSDSPGTIPEQKPNQILIYGILALAAVFVLGGLRFVLA